MDNRYINSLLAGTIAFGLIATVMSRCAFAPKQVYVQEEDLNKDGITDLVIETKNKHKTPMYGIKEGDKIIYFSAEEIIKKNPNDVANYRTIESKLNSVR